MSKECLASLGVDAATGEYAFQLTKEDVARISRQEIYEPIPRSKGVAVDDPSDLSGAGWGVVFAAGVDPQVREALHELLDHRKAMAAASDSQLYHELTYYAGESKLDFLQRHGLGLGPVEPDRLPYYLLLVGSPEEIPFSFQYQLGVQFAVGRICFDSLDEYQSYAQSVVRAETEPAQQPRKAALFSAGNNDEVTRLCTEHLVEPLAERLARKKPEWKLDMHLRQRASKQQLGRLLGGEETPALLFTTSHSACFGSNSPSLRERQGALICSDWPGLGTMCVPDHYFAAGDVAEQARLHGMICFHLSCFSAGTPRLEYFGHAKRPQPAVLADKPFIARLPQRLLLGGTLAVIGHIETTWLYSFLWNGVRQVAVYTASLNDIMAGLPVGMAMEHFGNRYGEMATLLSELRVNQRETGKELDADKLVKLWTVHNDARSFIVLGDPAVRLRTEA